MIANARLTAQIPTYYIFFKSVIHFLGDSEYVLRFVSAAASALSVLMIYFFSAKYINRGAGLFSAMLVATSTQIIWHAQEFRPYSLLLFLSLVGNLQFLKMYLIPIEREIFKKDILLYFLVCFLLSQLHQFGFFLVLMMTSILLGARRSLWFKPVFYVPSLIIVLLYAPWGLDLLKHLFIFENSFHDSIGMSFLEHLKQYFIFVTDAYHWLFLLPLTLLPGLFVFKSKVRPTVELKIWSYLMIWSFVPLLLFFGVEGVLKGSSFPLRHLMFALPGLFILVGWGAQVFLRNNVLLRLSVVCLLVFSLHQHVFVRLFYWTHNRLPSREIIADMHRHTNQTPLHLIAFEYWGDFKDYYLRDYAQNERIVFYQFEDLKYIYFENKLKNIPFRYVYSHYWKILDELLLQPEKKILIFINSKQQSRLNEWIEQQNEYQVLEVRNYLYSLYHLYVLEHKPEKSELE